MGEKTTVKNAKLYVMKDGEYEEVTRIMSGVDFDGDQVKICDWNRDVQAEAKSCDDPKTFGFYGKITFRASLMTWIRLLDFSEGIKTWLRMKFGRK